MPTIHELPRYNTNSTATVVYFSALNMVKIWAIICRMYVEFTNKIRIDFLDLDLDLDYIEQLAVCWSLLQT